MIKGIIDMKSVHVVIQQLRATSSKNEKLAILKANENNSELKQFLYLVYESSQSYYLTKINPKATPQSFDFTIDTLTDLCQQLYTRTLSGNRAKQTVADIYAGLNDWQKDLLLCIVDRDLKAGMNVSSVNKTWNNFLTEVPYMRCSLLKDANLSKWDFTKGMFSQIKSDGMFSYFNNVSAFKTLTRQGNSLPLEYISHLIEDFDKLPKEYQYQGECLVYDNETKQILSRKAGNGLLNSALKSGDFDKVRYTIKAVLWDAVPITEARVGNKYKVPYRERFANLEKWMSDAQFSFIELTENVVVYSLEDALAHFVKIVNQKLEGTILKNPDELIWEDTTSKYQVKFKITAECDLMVEEIIFDGKGKNKDLFRSLRCSSSDGLLKVNISGFSDKERQRIFDMGDKIIGKIAAVEFNDIITAEGRDTFSLFLPVCVEIREDKTTADDLLKIKAAFEDAKYNLIVCKK